MLSKEEVQRAVIADYEAVKGRIVLVSELDCYENETDSRTVHLDPPVLARIDPFGSEQEMRSDLLRWTGGDVVDPYWNLTILESRPELEGTRSHWMFGTSRYTSGKVEQARFEFASPAMEKAVEEALAEKEFPHEAIMQAMMRVRNDRTLGQMRKGKARDEALVGLLAGVAEEHGVTKEALIVRLAKMIGRVPGGPEQDITPALAR